MRWPGPAVGMVVALALVAGACGSGSAGQPSGGAPSGGTSLTVFAAASLRTALDAARRAYEASHPGTTLTISTDSSAALETKIEQGAPADVFLSADTANPQKLVDAGLAAGKVVPFAANHLTVIVPAANPAGIRTPAALARSGVKVIAAGDAVPVTTYANRVVANLARLPGYPANFAARYDANIVSREDNVAGIVAKIELGEGDAGIVYVTDAKASTKVATIDVPDGANVPATDGGVVVRGSPREEAAAAFLSWLAGPDGLAVLASFGFLPVS